MSIADIFNSNLEIIKKWLFDSSVSIAIVVGILVVTFYFAKVVRMLLNNYLRTSSKHMNIDRTQLNFLRHFSAAAIYIVGISIAIYTIESLRSLAISLFAGAGIVAVVVGFASQQVFSNMISGVALVIFKPFSVGDWVKFGNEIHGIVEDITLMHTVVRDWKNKRIIVPNSVIGNDTIENSHMEDQRVCRWVEIGISYDSDIDQATRIMQEEARKHPNFIDVRTKEEKEKGSPAVKVRLIGFGDSSMNLRAYVWANDPASGWNMGCDLNKSIKERFDSEGIEIPFPYRTIVYKQDKG